jgi:hypothetical protein
METWDDHGAVTDGAVEMTVSGDTEYWSGKEGSMASVTGAGVTGLLPISQKEVVGAGVILRTGGAEGFGATEAVPIVRGALVILAGRPAEVIVRGILILGPVRGRRFGRGIRCGGDADCESCAVPGYALKDESGVELI